MFPENDSLLDRQIAARRPTKKPLLYILPDPYRSSTLGADAAPWELQDRGLKVPLFTPIGQRPQPRLVDQAWIDIKMLKAWLAECEGKHDACYAAEPEDLFPQPSSLLFIDTARACLVQGRSDWHYVALSYVWGGTNSFLTTKDLLPSLYKPGVLDQSRRAILGLPRTISQAIALVKALGERYLWVDALCIVQDGDEKRDHLNAMASIYANAILTIVAAGGTGADQGFRGLRGISKRRQLNQRRARLTRQQSIIQPSSSQVWNDVHLRPWSTRAWTYQETICSRRLLIFANDSVRWCCKTARWSEESTSPDCVENYGTTELSKFNSTSDISSSPLPSHDEFETLVSTFNSRHLTYAQDAYHAFAGVTAQLGKKFDGAFICGLPEIFFDICLLWRPLRRDGPAWRRQLSAMEQGLPLPTWSWQGWQTEVSFPYTWNHSSDPAGPLPIMLGNTTVWRYKRRIQASDQLNARPWPFIENWWIPYARAGLKHRNAQVYPDDYFAGWTKRRHGTTPGFDLLAKEYERLGEVSFFSHAWDQDLEFCFPVPLSAEPQPPRLQRYIHFPTESARFKLGEVRGTMTRIHNLQGGPVGTLWQHDEEDEDFVRATTGELSDRPSIELIQIIGCSYPKSEAVTWEVEDYARDDYLEGLVEPKAFESVQNVIWIGRVGDLAFRKATGVVDDELWDASALEYVDVTMA